MLSRWKSALICKITNAIKKGGPGLDVLVSDGVSEVLNLTQWSR